MVWGRRAEGIEGRSTPRVIPNLVGDVEGWVERAGAGEGFSAAGAACDGCGARSSWPRVGEDRR